MHLQIDADQYEILTNPSRYRVLIAGRQWGKSHLAVIELANAATRKNSRCIYLSKTHKQARIVLWTRLVKAVSPWIASINNTDLSLKLINNSEISCFGTDEPDGIRGEYAIDLLIADEFAHWTYGEAVWEEILQPVLLRNEGRALFISTPKGHNWAYELYMLGQNPEYDNWASWQYSTISSGRIKPAQLEEIKKRTDARRYRQEYLASFESAVGIVYNDFNYDTHVSDKVQDRGGDLWIGMDFNVLPMSAVIAQYGDGDKIEIIDNISLEGTTTAVVDEIKARYGIRNYIACPDPSGQFRSTVGTTNWKILEEAGMATRGPSSQVPVDDRVNNVQRNLLTMSGDFSLSLSPKCTKLISTLSKQEYDKNGRPSKAGGHDHMNDALGYLLWEMNNLFLESPSVSNYRIH